MGLTLPVSDPPSLGQPHPQAVRPTVERNTDEIQ
ncbi:rCG63559 [Rattus norvegicus]|uniref:RCG63559 n=1 Tax=Rattus norvegicus TaxID=10116 RepID=A6IVL5_RAT|nr:rCG63559 [Rattus norvegicus]